MLELIFSALWFILPAYAANATPVVLHGKTPIDIGIKFLDGRPILGKGKTVKGLVFGITAAVFVGAIQAYFEQSFWPRVTLAFFLGFGALVGDSFGSFIKRRWNMKRGDAAPLLDQWGFVVMAMVFAFAAENFFAIPHIDFTTALLVMVASPILHVLANVFAYKTKLKKVPW